MIADTSYLLSLIVADEEHHAAVASDFEGSDRVVDTTPLILAELDHLIRARFGQDRSKILHEELRRGSVRIHWWNGAAVEATSIQDQYADLGISLADASLVALAARMQSVRIATLDRRHFRVMRPLAGGGYFTLLPADA